MARRMISDKSRRMISGKNRRMIRSKRSRRQENGRGDERNALEVKRTGMMWGGRRGGL